MSYTNNMMYYKLIRFKTLDFNAEKQITTILKHSGRIIKLNSEAVKACNSEPSKVYVHRATYSKALKESDNIALRC
jgi:hypothetical protein